MPKVKLRGPQVSESPGGPNYSNINYSPDQFGAGVGEGLERVGAVGQRITTAAFDLAQKERQKVNAARVFDGYTKLGQWQKEKLFDPKAGYLHLRGEDAIGRPGEKSKSEEYLKDFDTHAGNVLAELDDDQAAEFSKVVERERETIYRQMAQHEAREMDGVANEKLKGALSTAVSNAVGLYHDPQALNGAMTLGTGAILVRAQSAGWSPERIQTELKAFKTDLHINVLDAMEGKGHVSQMTAYFEANKKDIDPRARNKVGAVVQKSVLRKQALSEAEAIAKLESPDDQIAALESIEDPELREAARAKLGELTADKERIRAQARKPLLGALELQIRQSGGSTSFRYSKEYELLDDAGKAQAEELAVGARVRAGTGSAEDRRKQADSNKLADATFRALPEAEQAGLDVAKDPRFQFADETTRLLLVEKQKKIAEHIKKGSLASIGEFKSAVEAKIKTLPNKEDAALLRDAMMDWRLSQEGGVTPEQVSKKLAELTKIHVIEKGIFFDTKRAGYRMTPEERAKAGLDKPEATPVPAAPATTAAMVPGIPNEEVRAIQAFYKREHGRLPTKKEIRDAYSAKPGLDTSIAVREPGDE